ncbi:hypothetical protein [Brevibacterium sp. ZH18]|uniref:hypothetical protein n=1 Tax=Brevibacterium sp. ZH18 TaxID=2927784 RepID=UPI001F61C0C7|nr:hypothetical protein [Brevibacterium sp. ZH18]MCI4010583.1 hypothetical protein [Brevibacterium sp. ZH18]
MRTTPSAHRITLVAITLAALIIGLSGCIGRADLSDRADEIEAALSALPGVEKISGEYQNGFDSGRRLVYRVDMAPGATDGDLVNVAETLNSEAGDDFVNFERDLTLRLPHISVALNGKPDIGQLRQQLPRLRSLTSALSAETLSWEANNDNDLDDSLTIRDSDGDAFTVLSAVRDVFGSQQMRVNYGNSGTSAWEVEFPYSLQAQNTLAAALHSGTREMNKIEIDDDHVTFASARLTTEANATTKLTTLIDQINGGTSEPWRFTWLAEQPGGRQNNKTPGGTVSVGACTYDMKSNSEREPARFLTSNALKIQDTLRAKYDTCP